MNKNRLEAFSDGVLAIVITIMVLEMKVPHGVELSDLKPLFPVFLSYLLSFTYVAIYWNNHHHLLQATRTIHGGMMWANMHLLFWLSLVPFASGWMGENHFGTWPTAFYGLILLMAGTAYKILQKLIIQTQPHCEELQKVFARDWKGKASLVLYALAILLAFRVQFVSCAIYLIVALLWIVPDPRIEKFFNKK